MTVAIVPAEIWLGTEPFDFDAVVVRLKEYEDFMKKCVEYYNEDIYSWWKLTHGLCI
jgi:hypothetical protein